MNKILTVSVAAYNVEKYIRKTLDSCIAEEIMTELEVLVVDDGATDATAEIVREYEDKYPQTFRLIHKENGGYGTTVNRSMQEASGKYFRLLDGDDWFDTDGLRKLVKYLKKNDADAVFTQMYLCHPNIQKLEIDTWASLAGKQMSLSTVPENVFAGMWEFTVKTAILKEHPFRLPTHTLYTDHLFLAYPIPYIGNVAFLDFPLYCYRLGRDEQSISPSSRLRHLDDILRVSTVLSEEYKINAKKSANHKFALTRARFCHMEAYRSLLLLPCSLDAKKRIQKFDDRSDLDEDILKATNNCAGSRSLKFMRDTKYMGYYLIKGFYWLKKSFEIDV